MAQAKIFDFVIYFKCLLYFGHWKENIKIQFPEVSLKPLSDIAVNFGV